MEFLDEDVLDVTPLSVIPGDAPGPSSMAGSKKGNISDKSPHQENMHYVGRTIRNLVTRILNEGHAVKGVFTPLSRTDPSFEVEPQAEKDDESSRSEKEGAAEGLCSIGKNLPSKKPASMSHEPTENVVNLEEESLEEEDDTLVHHVKPNATRKLETRKGKTMAEMMTARTRKKTAGVVKKSPGKVAAVHLDNISFHLEGGVAKWKFVIQRRVAVERELGKEAVKVKELMELIKERQGILQGVCKR
ncbi:uncharacterized protein LOC127122429 [Lathyrus oleraceus]|uniref:uncharacterized protein LOC127122429 n=1 Tax=Pisum sativum TaxID=3888 RepID=UPI0021CE2E2F|nr:uncharacterized protein LOC127122429 [Pisum sativum]